MKRILNLETKKYLGKKVKVAGWVHSLRLHGGIIFLDLRDASGILQVVASPDLAKEIKKEYILEIEGKLEKRPKEMVNPELETGDLELKAEKIKILAKTKELPFDLKNKTLKLTLPVLLDFRPYTLRHPRIKAIFKVQEVIIDAFRNSLKRMGFFEFQSPLITPSKTEGGAEVFPVDYFDYKAYLAQSPQLYKQILVPIFERVFTVTRAFRAEHSLTTRHLAEYISLDVEMGFIDSWQEIIFVCEKVIKEIFKEVKRKCQRELKFFKEKIPDVKKIPSLKLREAQEIIFKRTKRDVRENPDLDPADEKEICDFAKEKYKSELIFVTHYPAEKRPFYTFPDPENPDYTLSFDLFFRGLEIVTGGQRINDYKMLISNLKKFGEEPKNFEFYLKAFKYGMPPEGGFAIGAERLTKQILGLKSVKEASFFPRDMERIDQRLSVLKKKWKEK